MRLLFLISFLTLVNSINAQVSIEGRYMGSNLYIQNPWDEYDEFCVDSVIVNGVKYSEAQEFAAFQIKLDSLGMSLEMPLKINIYHKKGCKPKVLNQAHHYQQTKLDIENFRITNDTLSWLANEAIPGRFDIQVYRWNKWVTLDSIQKPIKETEFQYPVQNEYHSGENIYRIQFVNIKNRHFSSKEIKYDPQLEPISYSINTKSNTLEFSHPNRYEIFDEYGLKVFTGQGATIDLSRFRNKMYYLNFDNQNVEIKLKR